MCLRIHCVAKEVAYAESMLELPFKKLLVWQKSMRLAVNVYTMTRRFPAAERYGLTSQIRRCAISIPSNIAEGSQRSSKKESANFLMIAKGSLAELETQLLLCSALQFLSADEAARYLLDIDEIARMLYSLHRKLMSPKTSPP